MRCYVETVKDFNGYGLDSNEGRILSYIGLKLLYQSKVEASHGVDSWVTGPHSRKDFPQGAEVLLHHFFSEWGVSLLRVLRLGPAPQIFIGRGLGLVFLPGWLGGTTMCIKLPNSYRLCSTSKLWKRICLQRPLVVQHHRKPSILCAQQEAQPPRFFLCESRVEVEQKGRVGHVI